MALAFSDPSMSGLVDQDLVRHVSLDGIRYINSKFRRKYGEPIIAIDSNKGSWRKQIFPYYKAHRKEDRKKSSIDWGELLRQINTIKNEIIEVFPYKVIEIDHAEADDIIGVLTRESININQEVMIVSGDKDFIQLQVNTDLVQQWDKRMDRYLSHENPKKFLFEHVLKGDSGDGIPNILSPADAIVNKIRQKPMTQKRLDEFWDDKSQLKDNSRFKDNLRIIDLSFTPKQMQEDILSLYHQYVPNDRSKLKHYFIEKKMRKLYENIQDY